MTQSTSQPIVRSRPVAEQVQDLLQQRILQGIYPPEQRMPSEQRLAQELNVSRATIRSALAGLAAAGLVLRKQGDGTYPLPNTLEIAVHIQQTWNIERQILRSGRKPGSQILATGLREASAEEAARLELEDGAQVYAIQRLFLADGQPVMLARHVVRVDGLQTDFPQEAVQGSLLEFMSRFHTRRMSGGQVFFKALLAPPGLAQTLQVSVGSALLLLEASIRDENNRPLLVAWEYYLGQEGFLLPLAPVIS
jgi:GntR family transcriptional regulator